MMFLKYIEYTYIFSSSLLFIYCFTQNCRFYVVCWAPAVMRCSLETQPCAWPTALSWREFPAASWALILCCCCCGALQVTLRRQLCSKTQPLLSGSCVEPSPGALSCYSINYKLLITFYISSWSTDSKGGR